jgi:hypothetical protein
MIKIPCTLGENEASILIFGIGILKAPSFPTSVSRKLIASQGNTADPAK